MSTRTIPVLACLAIIAAPGAFAARGAIRHVELYPSGASVTRSVEVAATGEGGLTVEVADLPASILASSIQIAPVDAAGLRVGGFAFLPEEKPVKEDDPRTADLRAAVERIDSALRLVRLEREGIEARVAHYRGLSDSIRQSLTEKADAAAFELARTAWGTLEEVRSAGDQRLAELAVEGQRLGIERQQAQKDLDERVAELRRRSGVLRFDLSGDLSAGARLLVRYQVREAGWRPVHEIRANPAAGTVEWIYKARIWQQSGEDWDGVQVSLNSASALHAGGLPTLDPLFLERMEARPLARGRAQSAVDAVYELAPFAMRAEAAPAEMEEAVPESTTTGFFIRLPQPVSLKSAAAPAVREAFTGTLQAEFWSEAVPELSTDAWLMAGMTNDLGWPILAGESYSYIDGQLVARRGIGEFAAGEEIELALGRNEKVSIERKDRVRKESQGGLIDRTRRHEIKHETTVENRMAVAHRVVLQDRFPIGRDNKIQVRTISPKDVTPEEGTGIFKWERMLEPSAKGVLTTEYTVTYPAEWTIHPPL
jgi:uncharacterized protein (TIGR02231 family)